MLLQNGWRGGRPECDFALAVRLFECHSEPTIQLEGDHSRLMVWHEQADDGARKRLSTAKEPWVLCDLGYLWKTLHPTIVVESTGPLMLCGKRSTRIQ